MLLNVFVLLLLWNLFPIIFFEFVNLLYVLEKINFNSIQIPIFSKIFEKLMHLRLTEFINDNNILNENQFGFKKK